MKLSICIPTYKRAVHLGAFLQSIFEQIDKNNLRNRVEVLVSDNCSPDNTSDVVTPYLDLGLLYSRNDTNIGPDANFLKLFELASGDYVWLPGDDDLTNADTLQFIMSMIDAHGFDYLFLRTDGPVPTGNRGAAKVSARDLLWRTSIFTTFMTSQVIRASLIKSQISAARRFLGGFMAYYSIFLAALFRSKICLISDCREIYPGDASNTGGYSFYKVWSVSVLEVLYQSDFAQDKSLCEKFRKDMFAYLLLPISYRVRTVGKGFRFDNEDPRPALRVHYGSRVYRAVWSTYLQGSLLQLKLLHFAMRVISKLRRKIYGQIA